MNPNQSATLVGDGIENPANAQMMIHAAAMFGAACRFRDTKGLAQSKFGASPPEGTFASITTNEVQALHSRIVAFDNLPGARDVYGFRAGRDFAVMLGNERRGLSRELASLATDRIQIPMLSRRINCLNVAAASAVALYYLCAPPVGSMVVRNNPPSRRPELLLLGAGDHFELGSTIRSAAAFGWERALIEDRHHVWFGCDRVVRSEGRAAARRGRNEILLIPCSPEMTYRYSRVTVITCRRVGNPLPRSNFVGGPSQLVVIPDESRVETAAEDWSRFGSRVEFAHLRFPGADIKYHYRLMATIALAEISRQVGRRPALKAPKAPRPPIYDYKLAELAKATGELVSFEDLMSY